LLLNECLFRYRLSPKTFGYTIGHIKGALHYVREWQLSVHVIPHI